MTLQVLSLNILGINPDGLLQSFLVEVVQRTKGKNIQVPPQNRRLPSLRESIYQDEKDHGHHRFYLIIPQNRTRIKNGAGVSLILEEITNLKG